MVDTGSRQGGPRPLRLGLRRGLATGASFGALVALTEIHAVYVTTGRLESLASLALLVYDSVGGALAGAGIGVLLALIRWPWSGTKIGREVGIGILLVAGVFLLRAGADAVFVVFPGGADLTSLLIAALLAVLATSGAAALHVRLLAASAPGATPPLVCLWVAATAVLYAGVVWTSLVEVRPSVTYFCGYLALTAVAAVLLVWLLSRTPRSVGPTALIAVLLACVLGRVAVGVPALSEVLEDDPIEVLLQGSAAASPNVILIVLDTLRADHLEVYGYERETMPFLTRFAAGASVFLDCVSSSSWTLPGHASLFTGLRSRQHAARGGSAQSERPGRLGHRRLEDEFVTLAEVAREAGYRTVGVGSNWLFLRPSYGLNQGFGYWDARPALRGALSEGYFPFIFRTRSAVDALPIRWVYAPLIFFDVAQTHYRRAREVNAEVFDLLDRGLAESASPVFLFLNYNDPHAPYQPPREFAYLFPGRLAGAPREHAGLRRAGIPSERLAEHLISQYDSELAYLDSQLEKLFQRLEVEGLLDDSIVIITSDHGEAFGEHGRFMHARSLHHEEIHVPLIVRLPDPSTAPPVVTRPVELASIAPWLLGRLGLPLPPGVAPRDIFDGDARQMAELYGVGGVDHIAMYRKHFKAIRFSDDRVQLYDRSTDPGERHDLSETRTGVTDGFRTEMTAWLNAHPLELRQASSGPDAGERKRLEALGYLE